MDDDDPRLLKALARYQVVSAYSGLEPNRGQRRATLDQLAKRTWIGPDGQAMRVSAETIRTWVRRYRRGGFDALLDKERPSAGVKALPPDVIDKACALKQQVPHRTLDVLIRILEDLGHAEPGTVRRSTLHRALQARGLSGRPRPEHSTEDLDRFEAAAPNDLWQADMRTGPWLPDPRRPGHVRRSWLYAFIDDHSRHVLDARFSFKGDMPALELCLRRAVQKWGVPRKVYYDNGQVFRSVHMRTICARLDIQAPIFTTVGRPEGTRPCRGCAAPRVSDAPPPAPAILPAGRWKFLSPPTTPRGASSSALSATAAGGASSGTRSVSSARSRAPTRSA